MSTAPAISSTDTVAVQPAGRSLWGDAYHRLSRDWVAVVCFVIICLYVALAIGAGFLFPDFAEHKNYDARYLPPSWEHPLGTDVFGRSVLAKTMLGAKVSMTVGFMANAIAIPFGLLLGVMGGYFGKWVDDFVVWFYSTMASIPGIIRLIAIKYAFQGIVLFQGAGIVIFGHHINLELDLSGIHGLYIALGIMSWVGTCRLVRAETFKLKELDYVTAARALGQGNMRILIRQIMPNLMHLAIINFTLGFVAAIAAEVILSFLGLGVDVGTPSWGTMINAARLDLVVGRWWEVTSACVAMFIIVLALNIFGDRLRDALDPKLRV